MCINKTLIFTLLSLVSLSLFAQEDQSGKGDSNKKDAKTPIQQASESAAREVGRVIGRKIGEDAVNKMSEPDRNSILERTRAAMRGQILYRYVFSDSPYMNSITGYISVLKEGRDYQGNVCKHIELDLIYRVERIFDQIVLCQHQDGEWTETDIRDVQFPRRGEADPGRPSRGGWLPPLP